MELVQVIVHEVLNALYEVTGVFILVGVGVLAHYWTVWTATK